MHSNVYTVFVVGLNTALPDVVPAVEKFVPVHWSTSVEDQIRVMGEPAVIDVAFALRVAAGRGRVTWTRTDSVVDFEALEQVISYVVVSVGVTVTEPDVLFPVSKDWIVPSFPSNVPTQVSAFVEFQLNLENAPRTIDEGRALKETPGTGSPSSSGPEP
jgi:hypothetical protein